jgi:hypothetical protein
MTTRLHEDCPPLSIAPGDVAALDQWLDDVRALAPMAQPTAYRLALELQRTGSTRLRLTDDVRRALGRDVRDREEDLFDLYRSGLLAMWLSVGSAPVVTLLQTRPVRRDMAEVASAS